jgi:hypothetical protein
MVFMLNIHHLINNCLGRSVRRNLQVAYLIMYNIHAEYLSYDTAPLINHCLWRSVGRNLQVAYLIMDNIHAEYLSYDTAPLINHCL